MTRSETYKLALRLAKIIASCYGADPIELANYTVAIVATESNFNPLAKNKNSTARGLMQILICTQREVEKKYAKVKFAPAMYNCKQYPVNTVSASQDKIFDPEYNLTIGMNYLGYQYRRYSGSWKKAVHAFNQGSYRPGSYGDTYLSKVESNLDQYLNIDTGEQGIMAYTNFKGPINYWAVGRIEYY